ncbi:hypothetical protein DPQ33_09660 [Oceanidesulfovibrio indonesiensis]|uniref:Uncharacterized protein n=1 Tax=Oceanidesulfovibrio indonesiensis TaxID=54767 RepID=A0A7M3ME08_9BACT|nr:hypothetical protein [Oceanidesulfovibrio indonesiensis]TVM17058.1 hypothetical protein DPQ33_09660 [Oceanidesulfovibrio indonesiensis]
MNAYTNQPSAPFFGLGFDMSPAVARAMSLTCVRAAPGSTVWIPEPRGEESMSWGYALMVALSREIRAG